MKIYKKRDINGYIKKLKSLLERENAKNGAFKINFTKSVGGKAYDKCIRIDFIGIAATTLFDVGSLSAKQNVYEELFKLLSAATELNKEGYFFKIRFILEYPYSISAYTRIQAEHSIKRSSILEPKFLRDLTLSEQVDKSIFDGSAFVTVQNSMLRQMQELLESVNDENVWNSDIGPNSFILRFTPITPNMCCLFINDYLFYDVYTLAKEKRQEDRCRPFCPITEINKKEDLLTFSAFEDHFRYIWDLDVTMDCEDATYYELGKRDTLSKLKPPHLIKFTAKVGRLKAKLPKTNNKEFKVWESGINRLMNRFCANLSPTPSSESIFITCSWEKIDGRFVPHHYAQELYIDLQDDLNHDYSPVASVKILEAALTEFLANELYNSMEDSTIGVVILTKDIEAKDGTFYSKPNVYHELGYMMKHLTRDRMIILAEEGVKIPSNIQDITRLDFSSNKLILKYKEIIRKIKKITMIDDKSENEILQKLLLRLNKKMTTKEIDPDEYKGLEKEVEKLLPKKTN